MPHSVLHLVYIEQIRQNSKSSILMDNFTFTLCILLTNRLNTTDSFKRSWKVIQLITRLALSYLTNIYSSHVPYLQFSRYII